MIQCRSTEKNMRKESHGQLEASNGISWSYLGSETWEIKRRVYGNIHMLCRMKTDLKPCAQIGPIYSNLSAQLHSETDFLFSLYWILTIQQLSVWAGKPLIRLVGAWLAILRIFNSISVISRRWTGDNEKLYAMEPRLRLERSAPRAGLEPRTILSIGQGGLTYWATGALRHWLNWAAAQTDMAILRSNMPVFSNDVPHLVCICRSMDWFESRLLEILDNKFIYFLKHLTSPKFWHIRLKIPTSDVEAEIKVSERKQVKFKSVNF